MKKHDRETFFGFGRLSYLVACLLLASTSTAQTISDIEMVVVTPPPVALPGSFNQFTVRFTNNGPDPDSASFQTNLGPIRDTPILLDVARVKGECRATLIPIDAAGDPLTAFLGSPFLGVGESGECTFTYETSRNVRLRFFETVWNPTQLPDPNPDNDSTTIVFGFSPALSIPATSKTVLLLLIMGIIGIALFVFRHSPKLRRFSYEDVSTQRSNSLSNSFTTQRDRPGPLD